MVVDSTTQASKQSTRHLVDDFATQECSDANSIADDSDEPFEVPRYLQPKNERLTAMLQKHVLERLPLQIHSWQPEMVIRLENCLSYGCLKKLSRTI